MGVCSSVFLCPLCPCVLGFGQQQVYVLLCSCVPVFLVSLCFGFWTAAGVRASGRCMILCVPVFLVSLCFGLWTAAGQGVGLESGVCSSVFLVCSFSVPLVWFNDLITINYKSNKFNLKFYCIFIYSFPSFSFVIEGQCLKENEVYPTILKIQMNLNVKYLILPSTSNILKVFLKEVIINKMKLRKRYVARP